MLEIISKFWVEWLMGIAAGGMIAACRVLWKRQKEADKRQRAVEAGIRALLRDRILQAYYHYTEGGRAWITLHGLENVEALYKEYHALGGNGPVTKLVEDLRELEVRDG